MLNDIFSNFIPWIFYFFLAKNSPKFAITVAVITAIFIEYKTLSKKFVLSIVNLIFFTALFVTKVLNNNDWLLQHSGFILNALLASIAWGSFILKKPFTLQYAKMRVDQSKWQHPLFWRINYLLTATWGVIFLINCVMNLLFASFVNEILSNGLIVLGIAFSAFFPAWYAKIHSSSGRTNGRMISVNS